ncbi:MAG: ABC-type transport system involved in multi-copper enzyme maturation, permease component [Acidobacteria bacterium]|nr:ABC-type transport system involved in multi-copper enzyme maturation, permease component [Acidobacteriota bacterium]
MPIHDQSYRRYGGDRAPEGRAWTVIAAAGIKTMLAKRKFLGLLLVAWLPFIVRAVQMYVAANFPQASMLAPSAETFRQFLEQQGVFTFFITIFTGAGLIANDLRANALQIYLSKPLGRFEYIAGKFGVLGFFLLLVTWLPATMLLVIQATGIETIVLCMVMLALSSLSKSARFVGIMYAGVVFFTHALYGVVVVVTRTTTFSWMSLQGNLLHLGDLVFRLPPRYDTPAWATIVALAAIVGAAAFVLERRVRGVEVVT